jgi:hypothetical protein
MDLFLRRKTNTKTKGYSTIYFCEGKRLKIKAITSLTPLPTIWLSSQIVLSSHYPCMYQVSEAFIAPATYVGRGDTSLGDHMQQQ